MVDASKLNTQYNYTLITSMCLGEGANFKQNFSRYSTLKIKSIAANS